jgi:hypothetical protein
LILFSLLSHPSLDIVEKLGDRPEDESYFRKYEAEESFPKKNEKR